MKFRLIAPFGFIVLLAVGLLIGFGVRLANDEQRRVQDELRTVYRTRLADTDRLLKGRVEGILTGLKRETAGRSMASVEEARRFVRRSRFVRQVFVLDSERRFLIPSPNAPLTRKEQDALIRTQSVWDGGISFVRQGEAGQTLTEGWHTWFWGPGLQFLYWMAGPDGTIVCLELDRTALVADLLSVLPTGSWEEATDEDMVMLRDERQGELYRWGRAIEDSKQEPFATLQLSAPLEWWSLALYPGLSTAPGAIGTSVRFNLISGLGLLGVVTLVLAAYGYRETSRDLREASQRLTFVNQVSHELKTPLTNIRLYAEILDQQLDQTLGDESAPEVRQSLGVIHGECQRLSRLIKNVLTFAKRSPARAALKMSEGEVDDVIANVLEGFRPSLEAKRIRTTFNPGVGRAGRLDRDAVEQILGNLVSNVEKYAAEGEVMEVTSERDGTDVLVQVSDQGPGIPREQRGLVFEPFWRLSDKVSDGVAGTGIGLTIARDLARAHGGDLEIRDADAGACFRVRLRYESEGDAG